MDKSFAFLKITFYLFPCEGIFQLLLFEWSYSLLAKYLQLETWNKQGKNVFWGWDFLLSYEIKMMIEQIHDKT